MYSKVSGGLEIELGPVLACTAFRTRFFPTAFIHSFKLCLRILIFIEHQLSRRRY